MKAVKGTRDILPPASAVGNRVEAVAREVFRTFNEIATGTYLIKDMASGEPVPLRRDELIGHIQK
jgi:histidyl-tRNA synthetase